MGSSATRERGFRQPNEKEKSFTGALFDDVLMKSSRTECLTYFNVFLIYCCLFIVVAGFQFSTWNIAIFGVMLYITSVFRKSLKEKERRKIAHRIPYFTDALANALAVGATLEQGLKQSLYYLKGDINTAFKRLLVKKSLGKDIGPLLVRLNEKFPGTGLNYLITLLEEYRDMGIGISPLLKQLADALMINEEADEKIRSILAGGSTYARMSIVVFGISFVLFALLQRDQVDTLMGPSLMPTLTFLLGWGFLGIVLVTRITALDFSTHYALRPYVKEFISRKRWTITELLDYAPLTHIKWWKRASLFVPLIFGFGAAYATSLYYPEVLYIEVGFLSGIMLSRMLIEYFLKGLVEDELIKVIETFPDFLQVFIIGLNSGLNQYLAFQFALNSIETIAPKLLIQEMIRVKQALDSGESHDRAWQRLADRLPFEAIIDFCETMVISPLHGESIVKSINQMMTSYKIKKMLLVEKKANALGQLVIPVIVLAFFPIFLFAVFAPLLQNVSKLFGG